MFILPCHKWTKPSEIALISDVDVLHTIPKKVAAALADHRIINDYNLSYCFAIVTPDQNGSERYAEEFAPNSGNSGTFHLWWPFLIVVSRRPAFPKRFVSHKGARPNSDSP